MFLSHCLKIRAGTGSYDCVIKISKDVGLPSFSVVLAVRGQGGFALTVKTRD